MFFSGHSSSFRLWPPQVNYDELPMSIWMSGPTGYFDCFFGALDHYFVRGELIFKDFFLENLEEITHVNGMAKRMFTGRLHRFPAETQSDGFLQRFLGWRMLAQGVWQVIEVTGSLNKAQLNWAESLQLYRGSSCRQTDGTEWEATGPGHLGVIHFQQV